MPTTSHLHRHDAPWSRGEVETMSFLLLSCSWLSTGIILTCMFAETQGCAVRWHDILAGYCHIFPFVVSYGLREL